MKVCSRCEAEKTLSEFYPDKSKSDGVSSRCRSCQKNASRERHWADPEASRAKMREYGQKSKSKRREYYWLCKLDLIEAYGGQCSCCGEGSPEFLTIDHVGGWGKDHRAESGGAYNMVMYLRKHKYPQDGRFQLLCFNCNCSLGMYGRCPHMDADS